MKKLCLFVLILAGSIGVRSQTTNPTTTDEIKKRAQQAQQELDKLTPEQRKMMEQMGMKMPDMSVLNGDPGAVNKAMEDEFSVVPKRKDAVIAAIPQLTAARLPGYLTAIDKKIVPMLAVENVQVGDAFFSFLTANPTLQQHPSDMVLLFWTDGKQQLSIYLMGRICEKWPSDENLSNYASMLTMAGGGQLAIPMLNLLNAKTPGNSTLLNNLGQAWLSLGETGKAEKYIDSTLALYAYHPQANMAKAALEESRGNKAKAIAAVQRSIKHAYSKDKENKLRQLGYSMAANDALLPGKRDNDLFNLGGFQTPAFPTSVQECISSEWNNTEKELEQRVSKMAQLTGIANARLGQNALKNFSGGVTAHPDINPIWYDVASKRLKDVESQYKIKITDFNKRYTAYEKGEFAQKTKAYRDKIAALDKQSLRTTGEGLGNKDFCPEYRDAANAYLAAVNPKLEQFYREKLVIEKTHINQLADLDVYMKWPEQYEVAELGYKTQWLGLLRNNLGESGTYPFPFVYIREYDCGTKPEVKQGKLADFDTSAACKFKSVVDLKIIVMRTNCSTSTIELNLNDMKGMPLKDLNVVYKELGNKFSDCTIKFETAKAGMKAGAGPVKAEAGIGSKWNVEVGPGGTIKDWSGTVTAGVSLTASQQLGIAEASAGVGSAVEVEMGKTGQTDVTIVNTAQVGVEAGGKSADIGVESRSSLITGNGALTGTGILSGTTISKW